VSPGKKDAARDVPFSPAAPATVYKNTLYFLVYHRGALAPYWMTFAGDGRRPAWRMVAEHPESIA
jgi:hypothetical protein